MLYITTFLTSVLLTGFLFFKFYKTERIDCFPYIETVQKIKKEAVNKIFTGTYNPEELDLKLRLLNRKVKNSKKFLLDCAYVAVPKNNSNK